MYTVIKNIKRSIIILLAMVFVQTAAHAQPVMIPGFMGIESSYMHAPEASSDSATAFFTIANLHYEPIVVLGLSGDMFDHATLVGSNGAELDQVIIEPGDRLVMSANDVHFQLSGVDSANLEGHFQELTLLVRRGLEPLEEVEAQRRDANNGQRGRDAGVPNEHKYVVNVPLRN